MRLFIPSLGSILTLEEDWQFQLHCESRNHDLWGYFDQEYKLWNPGWWSSETKEASQLTVTLLAGTQLKVDRIYIRKGAQDYDSVTFYVVSSPDDRFKKKGSKRFWVKLRDVNTMEIVDAS